MEEKKLTAKQKRFAEEYLIDLNATQAAIRAGYSKKTADQQGSRMLANVKVREYVKELMDERKNNLIASQEEVLQTLTAVMRREKLETIVTSERLRTSSFDKKGRKVTTDTEKPVCVEIPTKISDVNKAAELLGRRYSLFSDNLNIEGEAKVVIVDDLEEED